ncbi:MAG: imidazole glycerol phosphate synthase subunit HisF [Lentisphaerae bacterium GWF2_45_14]|nr:MAG: imidazole glycerol phosphate synthase subunit HisF [Lentisphaerae bacterium GWF2_45_14]
MLRPRIFPTLLLSGQGLVKGVKFKNYKYVGDPLNAVKIFNDKKVDELMFLDISATREGKKISPELVSRIADECFMPFGVGGGIESAEEARDILSAGAEKVSVNTAAVKNPALIGKIADIFGRQSVVVSIDVKANWLGRQKVVVCSGKKMTSLNPVEWAVEVEKMGAGEILLNSVDRDGTMSGYDLKLVRSVVDAVHIPVIACGGAGSLKDLSDGIHIGGAQAVTAGSFFVFHGRRRGVLINFPSEDECLKIHKEII